MPHKCTNCEKVFPDGCEEILDGCDCGNKKFKYTSEEVESDSPDLNPTSVSENKSQKKARTDMVDKEALPTKDTVSENIFEDDTTESEDIEDILNNQFEGITILERGKYELNISKLFKGDSKIIKIQEDGKYVVDVAETFKEL